MTLKPKSGLGGVHPETFASNHIINQKHVSYSYEKYIFGNGSKACCLFI
jgi:hypothetical protein